MGLGSPTFFLQIFFCFQQKLTKLVNLYLSDNMLEAVPYIPESVRILHLQVSMFY